MKAWENVAAVVVILLGLIACSLDLVGLTQSFWSFSEANSQRSIGEWRIQGGDEGAPLLTVRCIAATNLPFYSFACFCGPVAISCLFSFLHTFTQTRALRSGVKEGHSGGTRCMMIVESIVDVAVIVLFVVLLYSNVFPVYENEAPTQFDNDVVGSFIRRPENIAFCSAVDFVATLGLYPDPVVSVELPAGSDKPEPGSKIAAIRVQQDLAMFTLEDQTTFSCVSLTSCRNCNGDPPGSASYCFTIPDTVVDTVVAYEAQARLGTILNLAGACIDLLLPIGWSLGLF
jgi:uncharacterized membrane protein